MEFKLCFKQILENTQSRISYTDDKVALFQDFLAKVETPIFVEKLENAVRLIKQRDKLFCAGIGPTGSIAYYAATHLSAAGYFTVYIDESSMLTANRLSADNYILFCVSGESKEMMEFVGKIKKSGGKILLITNSNYSTLAQMADIVIAYNVYYARSLQRTLPTLAGHEDMDNVVDSFSTQLPAVYLIETIAKALRER
jgi:DNA-binding MurR/RpiR family transcriptional regulator